MGMLTILPDQKPVPDVPVDGDLALPCALRWFISTSMHGALPNIPLIHTQIHALSTAIVTIHL